VKKLPPREGNLFRVVLLLPREHLVAVNDLVKRAVTYNMRSRSSALRTLIEEALKARGKEVTDEASAHRRTRRAPARGVR
jgi:hypothetical protein